MRSGSVGRGSRSCLRRKNGDFDAAILPAVILGLLIVYRLVFAEADDLNSIDGDIFLANGIGLHGFGAAAAQLEVVIGWTDLVGKTLNRDEIALCVGDLSADERIELLLGDVAYSDELNLKSTVVSPAVL